MSGSAAGPQKVIWDVTYACPLRCVHCYSESGRRPSRRLGREGLLRVTDAIIELGPGSVALAGGEPLLVNGIFEVAARLRSAGVQVALFTGGWSLRAEMVGELLRVCDTVVVSLDGATAEVHDRIRGRPGSFAAAMSAFSMLDSAIESGARAEMGVDGVVLRSNFDQLERYCTEIAPRFPRLSALEFGAVVPAGLASRTGFGEHELLSEGQMSALGGAEPPRRLQSLAPDSVQVGCTDNLELRMGPDAPDELPVVQVEPDGAVRAMPVYEGTVGTLLSEPGDVLWQRALQRRRDPFVVEVLSGVRTVQQWAEAARTLDRHFGSEQVRARIDRRPAFAP